MFIHSSRCLAKARCSAAVRFIMSAPRADKGPADALARADDDEASAGDCEVWPRKEAELDRGDVRRGGGLGLRRRRAFALVDGVVSTLPVGGAAVELEDAARIVECICATHTAHAHAQSTLEAQPNKV